MNISIATSRHEWIKKNLVTLNKNGKYFDEVVCSACGMKGKRYNFTQVEVDGRYKKTHVQLCPKAKDFVTPDKIKITFCSAQGPNNQFANLIPESVHNIITPPKGYLNDRAGVWVMGIGEPVRVLAREFEVVKA